MVSRADKKNFAAGFLTVLALGLIVVAPLRIEAQVAGATLSGRVTDPSGAVISNAQVAIRNVATEIARLVKADAAGFYTAPNLLPGTYEGAVSAPGFSTAVLAGITLTVGVQQAFNVTLRIGEMSQKVEVTGEAPVVELTSSQR